jgi:hypothetical protein
MTAEAAMTIRQTTVTIAFLVLLAPRTGGAGGTIASPAIFQGPNQFVAECSIRNVGTNSMLVVATIFDESGNALPLVGDRCTDTPLAPGGQCEVVVHVPTGVAFACSATARSGSIKNARGTLRILSRLGDPERLGQLR